MDYVSTRNKERKVSAAYAIANGIAPDGGLYCPTAFPALTEADWKTLAESDYKGRSALILGKFLTDFSVEELADFAAKAYADEKFGGADTAPVVKLAEGKNLLELWHGPTCAFKDMALQMLPHLLTASAAQDRRDPHRLHSGRDLGGYRQGSARRLPRCTGHQDHGVLSGGRRITHAEAADGDAGGRKRRGRCHPRQL